MLLVKVIHLSSVVLSVFGFFVRGIWMLQESAKLQQRWVKIAPHIIDTLLLVSAVILAARWRLSPLDQPWLLAKIVGMLIYIAAGVVALRVGRSRNVRLVAWLFGLLTFSYIVSVALSKSVMGWFAYFQA